ETIVPLRWIVRPCALEAAGDGVAALAGTVGALPADALLLDRRALGVGTDLRRVAGAVSLAEGVTAGDQRHGLFVVHRHAPEGLADVATGCDRVRIAVWPLGVDVDQTHLDGAERLGQIAIAAVALVTEPRVLGAPEDLVRLP